MKPSQRLGALLLSAGLALSLAGCGSSGAKDDVAALFAQQDTMKASVSYDIAYDVLTTEGTARTQEIQIDADVALEYESKNAKVESQETITEDGESYLQSATTYCVGTENRTYTLSDGTYSVSSGTHFLVSYLCLAAAVDLEDYTKQENTDIIGGKACDVYTATRVIDTARIQLNAATDTTAPEDSGYAVDLVLRVYQDSGLPAALELSYSDANDQPYAYTSATGYTYTMTGFHCEIVYNEYNTQVDVTPPEDFVANATAQATNGTAEDTDSELVEMDVYTLSASDGSYDWEIDHPEYFTLEKQSEDSLTFYYFYSDRDLLSYTYTLMEDFSEEDAEDLADLSFAQLLLSYDVTNVERNDIVTTTVDGKSVSYAFLHYTMLADSEDEPDYEAFTVCAWVMAPNGKDLMWINMMELNGEGNGEELIPEHEITYSVEGIQCVTKS